MDNPMSQQDGRAMAAEGRAQVRLEARQHVSNVLPDLVGGLQAEEVEVAQQVVGGGQELQVELGQGQAPLPCTRVPKVSGREQQAAGEELGAAR